MLLVCWLLASNHRPPGTLVVKEPVCADHLLDESDDDEKFQRWVILRMIEIYWEWLKYTGNYYIEMEIDWEWMKYTRNKIAIYKEGFDLTSMADSTDGERDTLATPALRLRTRCPALVEEVGENIRWKRLLVLSNITRIISIIIIIISAALYAKASQK